MRHFYQRIPGWFNFRRLYHEAVASADNKAIFVEVGAWKGRSTAYMAVEIARSQKRIDFYVVDSWDGGEDPYLADDPDLKNGTLYDVFLQNIAPARKWLTPLKLKSVDAAAMFAHDSIDFVFIDATHSYTALKSDLAAWLPKVKVGGTIAGDDLHFPGMVEALNEVFGTEWKQDGRQWIVKKTVASGVDKAVFYPANIEGLTEWNIRPDYWADRKPGISAMIRLKNEAQFLSYSVDSILDWHEEVCLFPQGEQNDESMDICHQLARRHPDKVKVFPYPFESIVNGPGHHLQPRGSVHERAYFYNWCLSKTTCEFANKWDGDMIAHDWLGAKVREAIKTFDGIKFHGIDLVGPRLSHKSVKPNTASELRVHRVTPQTFYYTSTHCEHLSVVGVPSMGFDNKTRFRDAGFIHLKWCKDDMADSTVGWPTNWSEAHEYYNDIVRNKMAGGVYRGPYPSAIIPYLQKVGL